MMDRNGAEVKVGDKVHYLGCTRSKEVTMHVSPSAPITRLLLDLIIDNPGITPSELADLTGLLLTNVSDRVSLLARHGLVVAAIDPGDRRLRRLTASSAV